MSRDIWVISDTHFGHENIIRYCNRSFSNTKEMDEYIVDKWNSVVKDGDIVYHLGDVYFGAEGRSVLTENRLKGRKRLILGNHDNGKDQVLQRSFQKIMLWRMFPEFGLLLSHVPLHYSSLERYKENEFSGLLLNVHGHVHNKGRNGPNYRNVSVEVTNYTPVNIEELRIT